jgi:YVTN family beta-propeller protein
LSPNGKKLYASSGWSGAVDVIDTAKNEVVNSIKVGARPWGIAVTPDGRRLYAANGPSHDVSVVDLEQEKEISKVKTGEMPWGVAVVPVAE